MFRNRTQEGRNRCSRGGERGGVPVSFVVQHGVENDEQLAHAGGKGRFRVFPARPQLSVKVLDDRVGTNRGDHGHVENAPDLRASAPDATAAAQTTYAPQKLAA